MEPIIRDVTALDDTHRHALEEVIGRQLQANQRLVIQVTEVEISPPNCERPPQSLADWTGVYAGLNEEQIASIDRIAKTRANLTRHLP